MKQLLIISLSLVSLTSCNSLAQHIKEHDKNICIAKHGANCLGHYNNSNCRIDTFIRSSSIRPGTILRINNKTAIVIKQY